MVRYTSFLLAFIKLSFLVLLFSSYLIQAKTIIKDELGATNIALESVTQKIIRLAEEQNLHLAPRWMKLMHYKPDWQKDYESIVDDENFFLVKEGKYNPALELTANLRLFLSESEQDKARSCRFPARRRFIAAVLTASLDDNELSQLTNTAFSYSSIHCSDYQTWRTDNLVEQAWLIFPTAFLNSPSSMFGHTLLRFDLKGKSKLLSRSITYAAHADDQNQGAVYAFKGLFGGHPGYFSMLSYHKKVKEYTRTNNRDIWEYQLNLTADEIDWVMAHLWELEGIRFDYYFSTQNCSYQLLAVLEVARPEQDLTSKFDYLALPVDTIRALEDMNWITNRQFRASESRQFYRYIDTLTQAEKELVLDLQKISYTALAPEVSLLPKKRQRLVLEAAYKLRILKRKNKDSKKRLGLGLLRARSKLGKSTETLDVTWPVAPEEGHYSQKVGLGVAQLDGESNGVLDFKLSLHSLDDPNYGFDKGSQINFLHQQSVFDGNDIKLERFDLLNIRSLTPSDDYLTNMAWQINTGLGRHLMPDGSRRLNKQLIGGLGRSLRIGGLGLYTLVGGQLEGNNDFSDYIEFAPKVDLGFLLQNDVLTSELNISQYHFINANFSRLNLRWTSSVTLQKNQSISVNLQREKIVGAKGFNQVSAQFNLFF